MEQQSDLIKAIELRNKLIDQEKKICLNATYQLNSNYKHLMGENMGTKFVESCLRDLSGQIVREYFDLGDLYITADQLVERIIRFEYDNEFDPLKGKEPHKEAYNYNDLSSSTLERIEKSNRDNEMKVYHKRDGNESFNADGKIYKSRTAYKDQVLADTNGNVKDTLTGKMVDKGTIQGDHVSPMNAVTFNERLMNDSYKNEIDKVYNSPDNMQWIDGRANASKGDAATTSDTINKWENSNHETKQHLIDIGYLDEDGKVTKSVKKKLDAGERVIDNKVSALRIKNADYKTIAGDATKETKKSVSKIISGQVLYYSLPPIFYEAKTIAEKKNMTLDVFLENFKKACKRISKYVVGKLSEIIKGVAINSLKKFVKTFFDILIKMLLSTIKKAMQLVKNLTLAVIDSAKIVCDKEATKAQKADAVFNLVSVTIVGFINEVFFEYLETQGVPEILAEPLQMVTTILTTNLTMLILQKADLFNVKYGFIVANIEQIFNDSRNQYRDRISEFKQSTESEVEKILYQVKFDVIKANQNIRNLNAFDTKSIEDLNKINEVFEMGINFEKEWTSFLQMS